MGVKIKVTPGLWKYTNGRRMVEVDGDTVGECLKNLVGEIPEIKGKVFDDNGKLLSLVLIGNETVGANRLDRPVTDGEVISLLTLFGGG